MSSRRTGAKGVAAAIKHYSDSEYAVFVPVSDVSRYDLVVDDGSALIRVEVKTAANDRNEVHLRSSSPYSKGQIHKHMSADDCDEVFCYNANNGAYKVLKSGEFEGKTTVRVH